LDKELRFVLCEFRLDGCVGCEGTAFRVQRLGLGVRVLLGCGLAYSIVVSGA
jgi:hypothetical protein